MNKYIKRIALSVGLILTLCSCSNFLNVTPRNKKVVKSLEDYRDILASYLWFIKTPDRAQIPIMGTSIWAFPVFNVSHHTCIYTGESTLGETSGYYNIGSDQLNEDGVIMMSCLSKHTSNYWDRYYSFLGAINMLIVGIDQVENTNTDLYNRVKGEALAWRAFSYFKLLQYYSPYKNNSLGVPLYLDPSQDIGTTMPKRATQKEVFNLIISSCNQALNYLEKTPYNNWNYIYRKDFIHAMLASVYLWKSESGAKSEDDYKLAIDNASLAIGGRKLLQSPEEYAKIFDCSRQGIRNNEPNAEYFIRIFNDTNIDGISDSDAYTTSDLSSGEVMQEWADLYTQNDKRKGVFLVNTQVTINLPTSSTTKEVLKVNKYNTLGYVANYRHKNIPGCIMPFRLAEMYLIKAEALCKTGQLAMAIKVFNEFRDSRYTNITPFNGTGEELLKNIIEERKREFAWENDMVWLDLKRTGGSITRVVNGKTVTIEPHDFRYTFPVPSREMTYNTNMVQAPNWDKYF